MTARLAIAMLGGATLAGWAMTILARKLALKLGLMAQPNPVVVSHTEPVAYLGGLGVAAAVLMTLGISTLLGLPVRINPALLAMVGFAAVGLWDDVAAPAPAPKFAAQVVVAVVVAFAARGWLAQAPIWFELPVAVLVLTAFVNAVNLVDVCDGLAGGLAIVALLALAMVATDPAYAILLAGALTGFLVLNLPPAKIYLGDMGSHLIGGVMGVLVLEGFGARPGVNTVIVVALANAVFLFEIAFLIVARTSRGMPFWRPSPDHTALRLQKAGVSRPATIGLIWGAGILGATAAAGAMLFPHATIPIGGVVLLLAIIIAVVLGRMTST